MIYDSGTSCVTLLFIVIILFAPVFAMERRMDTAALILVSQHGRKKDAFARILACAIILLVLYALIHAVLFMVNLIKFGPSGGAVSAALAGFSLEAHTAMSMRELLALQLGMGLLAVWFVSAVTILLSSFLSSAKTWAVLFLAGSLWFMQAMAIRPGRSSSLRFSRCSLPAALISSGSVSSFCLDCSRSFRCFMFLWASVRKCWPSRYGGTRRHDDGDFGCTRYISVSE